MVTVTLRITLMLIFRWYVVETGIVEVLVIYYTGMSCHIVQILTTRLLMPGT